MAFNAKTDTPVAATAVAATDKFVFGDVSADGWDTILANQLLKALISTAEATGTTIATGGGISQTFYSDSVPVLYVNGDNGGIGVGTYQVGFGTAVNTRDTGLARYAAGQLKVTDGSTGLGELITDKLIARQDGGVAGTDEVQISHDGTDTTIETKSGNIYFKAPYEGSFNFITGGGNNHVSVYDLTISSGLLQLGDYQTSLRYGGATGVVKVGSNQAGSSGGGTLCSIPQTPTQITSNQNDYVAPRARYYRLSTDASRDVTGLSIGQLDGLECEIWNVGGNNIVLKHQDVNSTAANRFICTAAADITLAADEIALLRYDSTTARWRVRKV